MTAAATTTLPRLGLLPRCCSVSLRWTQLGKRTTTRPSEDSVDHLRNSHRGFGGSVLSRSRRGLRDSGQRAVLRRIFWRAPDAPDLLAGEGRLHRVDDPTVQVDWGNLFAEPRQSPCSWPQAAVRQDLVVVGLLDMPESPRRSDVCKSSGSRLVARSTSGLSVVLTRARAGDSLRPKRSRQG
jgi:hypothetical protein